MRKRVLALMLALVSLLSLFSCGQANSQNKAVSSQDTVTDLIGRTVAIPDDPKKIAAMTGPSYEMVFVLGGQDRLAMVKKIQTSGYPLANLTNPDLKNYEGINNVSPSAVVNIEDYLSRNVDLVIYYNNETELQKFENAGIPAVVLTLNTSTLPDVKSVMALTLGEYTERTCRPLKLLAKILGGDAPKVYNEWEKYTSGILKMLYDRTKNLSKDERPTVYWGNTWGENILSTYVLTNRCYEIKLAGGTLVGPTTGGNFPEVNEEQLFDWDPDLILVDNHGNSPDLVANDMLANNKWSTLTAVKTGNIHRIPAGIFFMDKGSTTALMTLWLATLLHPDLFKDISITEELQYYYKTFYHYDLTAEQAQKIIKGWYDSGTEAAF